MLTQDGLTPEEAAGTILKALGHYSLECDGHYLTRDDLVGLLQGKPLFIEVEVSTTQEGASEATRAMMKAMCEAIAARSPYADLLDPKLG